MPYKNPIPCTLCSSPRVSKLYCDMHYRRWKKFGDLEGTKRPEGWGEKTKHPLYHTWDSTRKKGGRHPRWDDFEAFLADVGEKPGAKYTFRRRDLNVPHGPHNFYWCPPASDAEFDFNSNEGRAEYARVWRRANQIKSKVNWLKGYYGLTLERYEEMLERQDGRCAICGEFGGIKLHIDHCHEKNHVRGLLCGKCNTGLGLFRDSEELLARAATYLQFTKHAPKAAVPMPETTARKRERKRPAP